MPARRLRGREPTFAPHGQQGSMQEPVIPSAATAIRSSAIRDTVPITARNDTFDYEFDDDDDDIPAFSFPEA